MIDNAMQTQRRPRRSGSTKGARRDIQALRAVAVGLVVLNHLWPSSLPGGYVGVDVFFVISGFLISKHLLGELDRTGTVRLGAFYARRIKRLLPAALTVSVVSLTAAWVFLPFPRWESIAQETVAATLYVENWFLAARSVDYSAANAAASTAQHYWSLSVEEQFYLVWPVFLLGLFLLAARLRLRRQPTVRLGLAAVGILSLVFCIFITYTSRSEAYFVTPARVWEFAAGGLLGTLAAANIPSYRLGGRLRLSGMAQWLGCALILLSALTFDESTFFPGSAALVPVAGTMLVLWSGPHHPRWSPNVLLAVKPVQFIGDISYSLYLWHWPLIVIAPGVLDRDLSNWDRAALLGASVVLAVLTKYLIEDPGRTRLFKGFSPRRIFTLTLVAMAVVTVTAGAMVFTASSLQREQSAALDAASGGPCFGAKSLTAGRHCADPFGPPAVAEVSADDAPWKSAKECTKADNPIVVDGKVRLTECNFANGTAAAVTVWLVGDSHAEHWQSAVTELARQNNWVLRKSLFPGCPIVDVERVAFKGKPVRDPGFDSSCRGWSSSVSQRINEERPDIIFVSSFGAGETIEDGTGRPQLEQYRDGFAERITPWANHGAEVYVLRDTPLTLGRTTADCLTKNRDAPVECSTDGSEALAVDPLAEAAQAEQSSRIKVLDFSDQFCPGGRCYAAIGGVHVYFDDDHVTGTYMRSLIPEFAKRFNASRSG
ncbi:acyltransferase [Arthrobacter crusticola]|uniref:Acyltransferase n=1 Tax=Arthrobacter crusticola TaxID=2547960 RepID=A0A4R5TPR3_9MICC|nr:acyltransferase family protein [Arthrobacter crusticola]TDK24168.1 acyltransferase [Arthrobacter crusticola]